MEIYSSPSDVSCWSPASSDSDGISSSNSSLLTLQTEAISSFLFSKLMRRTPCVARPMMRNIGNIQTYGNA